MKYNINLNQLKMVEWGLSFSEWCLVDLFSHLPTWADEEIIDWKIWYFFSKNKILDEMPVLSPTWKIDTVYRQAKSLVDKWFLEFIKIWKKDYWNISKKIKEWNFEDNSEKNPTKLGKKSDIYSEKNPTNNNTSINNNTKDNKYIEILDFWNSLKIVNHTKAPDNLEKTLDKILKKYTIDEVKQTMKKYWEVVLSKDYWFNYKWTLIDFLNRKNWFQVWFDIPKENYLIWNNSFWKNKPQNALQDKVDLWEINFWNEISVEDYLARNKK